MNKHVYGYLLTIILTVVITWYFIKPKVVETTHTVYVEKNIDGIISSSSSITYDKQNIYVQTDILTDHYGNMLISNIINRDELVTKHSLMFGIGAYSSGGLLELGYIYEQRHMYSLMYVIDFQAHQYYGFKYSYILGL